MLASTTSQAQLGNSVQSKIDSTFLIPASDKTTKDSILFKTESISAEFVKVENKISLLNKKSDSLINAIENIPSKYFKTVDKKINKYSNRISSKTEKTLTKLSRWENKIKKLLDKVSPETSSRLFGKNQLTFSAMLVKLKQGENFVSSTEAQYDKYRDKLNCSLKYLQSQKDKLDSNIIKPVTHASIKMQELDQDVANSEKIVQLIKERKKQLINESIKYIGKSKYLSKINKESYYYVETLRNYKEIFSDKRKAEQTALTILNKIPAYQKFLGQNSMLASLFGSSSYNTTADVSGLQTRSGIDELMQDKIAMGGPNAKAIVRQAMEQAQGEMSKLKDKVLRLGGSGSADDIPNFKVNKQKTKTFLQRIEYGGNYQLNKSTAIQPMIANLALNLGYKLNDKSMIGFGLAYRLGLGKIERIKISSQGIGFRSFIDWKLKKQLFLSGGLELNYNTAFEKISEINSNEVWQKSALLGISKKIKLGTKIFKGTSIQLMYDFLYGDHIPKSNPLLFRVGYSFK